jgi:hypothetical protein
MTKKEAQQMELAARHLAESRRVIRALAAERERNARRRVAPADILREVKVILQGPSHVEAAAQAGAGAAADRRQH